MHGPAANVGAWVVQTEKGALQGGKDGVSQSWMEGFWVIIMDLIHPALKKIKGIFKNNSSVKHCKAFNSICSLSTEIKIDTHSQLCQKECLNNHKCLTINSNESI